MTIRRFAVLATALLTGCVSPSSATPSVPAQAPALEAAARPDSTAAAQAYCRHTGGVVQIRSPWFPIGGKFVKLSGSQPFCHYVMRSTSAKSTIDVSVATLYSQKPTLAALAYYAKIKLSKACSKQVVYGPAVCYCRFQLYGADFFGEGGAWLAPGQTANDATPFCVFSDMSVIDSWGLTYHSAGIIRGKDLTKVLRYHP